MILSTANSLFPRRSFFNALSWKWSCSIWKFLWCESASLGPSLGASFPWCWQHPTWKKSIIWCITWCIFEKSRVMHFFRSEALFPKWSARRSVCFLTVQAKVSASVLHFKSRVVKNKTLRVDVFFESHCRGDRFWIYCPTRIFSQYALGYCTDYSTLSKVCLNCLKVRKTWETLSNTYKRFSNF